MHCNKALHSIASTIAKPLGIDQATASLTRPLIARVLVKFDVTQPPPSWIRIDVGDFEFWQNVNFEKISLYCALFKHFSHAIEVCYVTNLRLHP